MTGTNAPVTAGVSPGDPSTAATTRNNQRFPTALQALQYAGRFHAGQRRSADAALLMLHLLEVGSLLYHADAPDDVIAVGFLHDVLERSDADAHELRKRFGPTVANLVLALTEDARITSYE